MKVNWNTIKLFFKRILTGIMVIAVVAVIYYMFPQRGKFPFEYQKGTFWSHETLIAPFDFPVNKTNQQIEQERDSLVLAINPYFVLNEEVGVGRMQEFRAEWPLIWKNLKDSSRLTEDWAQTYLTLALDVLDSLYRTGILDPNGEELVPDWSERVIQVIVGQVSSERNPGEIVDPLGAYSFLKDELTDSIRLAPATPEFLLSVFQAIGFNRFLETNLVYDEEKNREVRQEVIENISETRGLIKRGQRIIAEGDMVNDDRLMVLDSYREAYNKELGDASSRWMIRIGQILLILLALAALLFYLFHYRREILNNNVKTGFIFLMLLLSVAGGGLILRSGVISIYLVPFIIMPVIIRNFYDSRTAHFFHLISMILIGFLVPNGFEFIVMQILVGFAAIISFQHLHRRGQLVMTALIVFLSYTMVYLSMAFMSEGRLQSIEWIDLAWLGGNSLLLLLSYPMIFIFEKLFGFVSDVTLIELSDSNHPVLRRMAEEAPGTFQHSLQVANLAESVIREIGGNPLLVRTGAMYHDIGKTENPIYFTENQGGGRSPHDQMTNLESAGIIVSHVKRGAEIARKHRLPKAVIDFILTHHGTSRTQYFLKKQQEENPGGEVDDSDFAYPGPRPHSRETAVLMMADSIEAASRSLPEYTSETISTLVEKIIDHQLEEGQFNEAELTFRDIHVAKQVFKKKLTNIYHARIAYPE